MLPSKNKEEKKLGKELDFSASKAASQKKNL